MSALKVIVLVVVTAVLLNITVAVVVQAFTD